MTRKKRAAKARQSLKGERSGSRGTTIRLSIRVYVNNQLSSIEELEKSEEELQALLPALAEKHMKAIRETLGMVEIEFLDEPDREQRFFRIGNDPRRMVAPMAFST